MFQFPVSGVCVENAPWSVFLSRPSLPLLLLATPFFCSEAISFSLCICVCVCVHVFSPPFSPLRYLAVSLCQSQNPLSDLHSISSSLSLSQSQSPSLCSSMYERLCECARGTRLLLCPAWRGVPLSLTAGCACASLWLSVLCPWLGVPIEFLSHSSLCCAHSLHFFALRDVSPPRNDKTTSPACGIARGYRVWEQLSGKKAAKGNKC